MQTKEEIKLVKKLLKSVDKNYGKWRCGEINIDCAACKAEGLRAFLGWHLDLLEWDVDKSPIKKVKKVV